MTRMLRRWSHGLLAPVAAVAALAQAAEGDAMELALSALTTEQFNLRWLAGVTPLPPGHPTLQELLQCRTALDGLLRR